MFDFKKQVCADCHFFVRTHHADDGRTFTLEVAAEQRTAARTGVLSWQREAEALQCYKGVWDEGVGLPMTKASQVADVRRNGKCYFFPHQPGMLLPTAESLLLAATSRKAETQKYRLAIYGLAFTALALLVKVLLGA